MSPGKFARTIGFKLILIPMSVIVLGGVIPGVLAYQLMQRGAERENHEKAGTILRTFDAVDRLTADEPAGGAKRKVTAEAEVKRGKAARAVADNYSKAPSEVAFKYKRVGEVPQFGLEAPTDFESRAIAFLQADTRVKTFQEKTGSGEQEMLAVASPVEVNGKIVGASVVYVPSHFAHDQASRAFWLPAGIVALLCLTATGLLYWRLNALIAKPILKLLDVSQAIRRGEWDARFNARSSDEFAQLASSFQETTRWLREKLVHEEKLRAMFQQFIPASVAAQTLGKEASTIMAGTRHSVSIVVINIRNFKLLMEHLPPEQTVSTLNEFFAEVNKVIVSHHGLVSKYLGDTVLATFGMPSSKRNHALDAVKAALKIPSALQNLYVRLDEKFGWELGVGIGITTGEPIVGHFGSSEHMEYTALGDVVVNAHWLEEISKHTPEEDTILIDEATYRNVMSDVHVYDSGEKTTAAGKCIHTFVVQGMRSEARQVLAA